MPNGFPIDLPREPSFRKRGEPLELGVPTRGLPWPEPQPNPQKLQIPLPSSITESSKSELEKMITGEYFNPRFQAFVDGLAFTQSCLHKLNALDPNERSQRTKVFQELFGTFTPGHLGGAVIRSPFYCEFGGNIHLGKKIFINFNCTILDVAPVIIGDGALIGPNVSILTGNHPVDPEERAALAWYALPVVLGPGCWIGGDAIILGGVTVGEGAVIGAGSVVTRDVEPYALVAGNPARKLRDARRKRELQNNVSQPPNGGNAILKDNGHPA